VKWLFKADLRLKEGGESGNRDTRIVEDAYDDNRKHERDTLSGDLCRELGIFDVG
jgi:hypothetical protein